MTRQHILDILAAHRDELRARGVEYLSLFGSFARDEAHEGSDVDLLVEFEPGRPVGLFAFVRLQDYLAGLLGRPVDLATPEALRDEYRADVLREVVHAG
jgi:predicted nucleotidyltransferase